VDKTGKKYWSSKPYFTHIYILYIGAQLGYGKAERYSFFEKTLRILDIACAEQYLCKRDPEHNTKRKTQSINQI
jgi:hypothetical protein